MESNQPKNNNTRKPFTKKKYKENQNRRNNSSQSLENQNQEKYKGNQNRRNNSSQSLESKNQEKRYSPDNAKNKWKKKPFKKEQYVRIEKIKKEPIIYETCPLCSEKIKEPLNAISYKKTMENAHFECIVKEVRKEYSLDGQVKLYYLGGGIFGVVEEKRIRNRYTTFMVKERIRYLDKIKRRDKKITQDTKA